MTIFFTSDTHWNHAHIIKSSNRPYNSIEEMDIDLIERWNSVVGKGDEVWHLGDFAWKDPAYYLSKLNGSVHLILGNHDVKRKVAAAGFASIHDVHYLRHQGKKFWLSHYAHRTWRSSNHGSFHLYGHSHGCLQQYGRSMDVGVDVERRYAPFSIDDVIDRLESADITDHHPVINT